MISSTEGEIMAKKKDGPEYGIAELTLPRLIQHFKVSDFGRF